MSVCVHRSNRLARADGRLSLKLQHGDATAERVLQNMKLRTVAVVAEQLASIRGAEATRLLNSLARSR